MFGERYRNSGYYLVAPQLPPGSYTVVAYAHSTVTNTFTVATSIVTATNVQVSIDTPVVEATVGQPFTIAGWAIDQTSTIDPGIDVLHIYAIHVADNVTTLLGAAYTGGVRTDVGIVYGSQFTNSGWGLSVSGLPAGRYELVIYAHRAATGQFEVALTRFITIQ